VSATLSLDVDPGPIERARADLIIVPLFAGEQPLRGSTGRVDWRLCGRLSELVAAGRLEGATGEAVLLASLGGVRAPFLLILGAGSRSDFDAHQWARLVADGVERGLGLRATSIALAFVEGEEGEFGLRHRAEMVLSGAAWAVARTGRPEELTLRVVVPEDEVPRTTEHLRAARPSRLPRGVAVRLPGPTPAAKRARQAPPRSPSLSPTGPQLVK